MLHRAAPEPFQQAAMLALGFCSSESVPVLLEEIQGLIEEYSSTRTSVSAQALEVTSLNGHLSPTMAELSIYMTLPLQATPNATCWSSVLPAIHLGVLYCSLAVTPFGTECTNIWRNLSVHCLLQQPLHSAQAHSGRPAGHQRLCTLLLPCTLLSSYACLHLCSMR